MLTIEQAMRNALALLENSERRILRCAASERETRRVVESALACIHHSRELLSTGSPDPKRIFGNDRSEDSQKS